MDRPNVFVLLLEKYEAMVALRRELEHGAVDGRTHRVKMAQLASRFPGVLRELEHLPTDVLVARRDEVARATLSTTHQVEWMRVSCRFHELLAGALCAKRLAATSDGVDAARTRVAAHPTASLWESEMETLANPPRGRLLPLVFARLAREFAMSEQEIRQMVYGNAQDRV